MRAANSGRNDYEICMQTTSRLSTTEKKLNISQRHHLTIKPN